MGALQTIVPDWPAPPSVRAASTTRQGGFSAGAFRGLNLAQHVGDEPATVERNRALLREALQLPAEPAWLQQLHGARVLRLPAGEPRAGDACWTDRPGVVCAVMTADCLPLLLCDDAGRCVAAVHAGWRGLAGGVIEAAVAALPAPPSRLLAWLGPAIGPQAFEVGEEVRAACASRDPAAAALFAAGAPGRFHADLYALARRRLRALGVSRISGGGRCTHREREDFYSFRRDGRCGRMATLIWLQPGAAISGHV